MRKVIAVLVLFFFIILILLPKAVKADVSRSGFAGGFQQLSSAYPDITEFPTDYVNEGYPMESSTPPTASFGDGQTPTLTFTPTITEIVPSGFVTATSSYANTAAAIQTDEAYASEVSASESPDSTQQPSPDGQNAQETPTPEASSLPSWTPSPSHTAYPAVQSTPRVLQKGSDAAGYGDKSLAFGLAGTAILGMILFGAYKFLKKH